MSRHRNVRNRAYSYEDEDYDDDDDDNVPKSPNSNAFMYRRDSPSRQRSIYSFVQQEKSEHQHEMQRSNVQLDDPQDAELVAIMVPKVQAAVSTQFSTRQITQELRIANYDVDKTVMALLEQGQARGSVLPLPGTILTLEAVALALDAKARQNVTEEVLMPASSKGKPMTIGVPVPSVMKTADVKKPCVSATDDISTNRALSRAQTQYTVAETKAFERAEAKTQEQALKVAQEARASGKTKISMVVIGHVDAGKSTITGHLLYKLGYVSQQLMHKYEKEARVAGKASFAYAWVMDADVEERSRGVTMDVGTTSFETATKAMTLLDAPGHRDFLPKMIAGAAQADVAVLVVPAGMGEFEAAFEHSGQTKEHTLLVRSLGVAQLIVAVNKMDTVQWSQARFDAIVKALSTFLLGAGFRSKHLRFVPLSGIRGINLEKTGFDECAWYSGPSLVEAIDTFAPPQRQITKPFRMTVNDVSKSMSLGQTISGRVCTGAAAVGDSFLLMPIGLSLIVKGLEQHGKSCTLACAGDTIEMGISGIDPSALTTGSIVCSIASPVQLAKKFEAKIMTMPAVEVPIVKGTCVTIHVHNVDEPVIITRLVSLVSTTGNVEKKPRCITRERSAVVQITCQRTICLEEFANYRQLGRFSLRDRGKTLAAGIVTQILA